MLSICITVKNRSRVRVGDRELPLFPRCVHSIVESVSGTDDCELVVTDFESDDYPLNEWLAAAVAPVAMQLITVEGPFSRGRGLNLAAEHARGNALLFIDADVLICPALLRSGRQHLRAGKAYFPVMFSFNKPDHSSGEWRHDGYGNCMVSRGIFQTAGQWPEFNSWGQEDEDFFAHVSALVEVARERVQGFYHQWHPNSIHWKNRYGVEAPRLGREGEQMRLACEELSRVIPPEASFILVDESRFCIRHALLERAIPFLERHGEYWGPPPDDTTAINELSRLRCRGAKLIAFAWMAFWWLDYYQEFHTYLQTRHHCILKTPRLVVFDLAVSRHTMTPTSAREIDSVPS